MLKPTLLLSCGAPFQESELLLKYLKPPVGDRPVLFQITFFGPSLDELEPKLLLKTIEKQKCVHMHHIECKHPDSLSKDETGRISRKMKPTEEGRDSRVLALGTHVETLQ